MKKFKPPLFWEPPSKKQFRPLGSWCFPYFGFSLNWPHLADLVIELPCPSVRMSAPLVAVFFRPLICPEVRS